MQINSLNFKISAKKIKHHDVALCVPNGGIEVFACIIQISRVLLCVKWSLLALKPKGNNERLQI